MCIQYYIKTKLFLLLLSNRSIHGVWPAQNAFVVVAKVYRVLRLVQQTITANIRTFPALDNGGSFPAHALHACALIVCLVGQLELVSYGFRFTIVRLDEHSKKFEY